MAGYADPELAGRLGVDPNTSFVDDVAKGDVTYFTRADGNAWTLEQIAADRDGFIADSKIHRIKRDQVKPPPPTAPVPHPPEFIPDSAEALAVCTTPDVCKVGDKPVPFQVYGKGSDDQNYAPNVFSNGQRLKLSNSVMTTTHGDEPGVNKGVKSGTVGDVVEPVTSSDVVFVNGNPAQRHGDECTLNNGNCPGEYVHVQSTAVDQAPDGRDAADKAEDTRNSAKKAFDGFYDNSSEAQAVGAGLKRLGDYTGDPTLIGQDLQSAWNSVPTADEALEFGENVAAGAGRTAEYVWNNPGEAASGVWNWGVDGLSGLWTGVTDAYDKGGVAQAGGHLAAVAVGAVNPFKKAKLAGRAAEGLEDLGDAAKAERLAREAEEGAGKARDAERATEDGSPGARSTRRVSLRRQYLGDTPSKTSKAGQEVRERMREEGLLRTDPKTGQDIFKAENGKWYPVDSPQTHMGHYPVDAVDYWNQTGRTFGARSPEVRAWMNDSANYRFEYGPLNMSRGGATSSRYLPPLK